MTKPYVILKCAISGDGFISAKSRERVIFSNEKDLRKRDELRANCDAVIIGGETLRADEPRLGLATFAELGERLTKQRKNLGENKNPLSVIISEKFAKLLFSVKKQVIAPKHFANLASKKIAIFSPTGKPNLIFAKIKGNKIFLKKSKIGNCNYSDAEPENEPNLPMTKLVAQLAKAGYSRILVEGGGKVLAQFLHEGIFDEFQISIAQTMLGASGGVGVPLVDFSKLNKTISKSSELKQLSSGGGAGEISDSFVLRSANYDLIHEHEENLVGCRFLVFKNRSAENAYKNSAKSFDLDWGEIIDRNFLKKCFRLAKKCQSVASSFNVGSVLVSSCNELLSSGFSREVGNCHAEEIALAKAKKMGKLQAGLSIYSSLEPCGERASGVRSCVDLILVSGIKRVVFGACEPNIFVEPCGWQRLKAGGIDTKFYSDFEQKFLHQNRHLGG